MEAELTIGGMAMPGLATFDHGDHALAVRETDCYSGSRPYNLGLFHTGCGGGPNGTGERTIFGLNTAIQAVGEGNYGRLGPGQQQRYTDAEAEPMFGQPYTGGTPDEQPGSLPEILPSPDFDGAGPRDANIERCWSCRAMFVQAWGHYGTVWPVVHQQLGVRPDMGRDALEVVPQLPSIAPIAGRDIRVGKGSLDVAAARDGERYRTEVDADVGCDAPASATRCRAAPQVPLGDARRTRVDWDARTTNRGLEVTVQAGDGDHEVVVDRANRSGGTVVAGGRPTRSRAPSGRRPSTLGRGWRARSAPPRRRRDGVQLGRAAELLERGEHAGTDLLGLRGAAGGAQAAPAQPGVERPHGAAVVGVRLEDAASRSTASVVRSRQHVGRTQPVGGRLAGRVVQRVRPQQPAELRAGAGHQPSRPRRPRRPARAPTAVRAGPRRGRAARAPGAPRRRRPGSRCRRAAARRAAVRAQDAAAVGGGRVDRVAPPLLRQRAPRAGPMADEPAAAVERAGQPLPGLAAWAR